MPTKINLPVTNLELKREYDSGLRCKELGLKYDCSERTIYLRLKSVGYIKHSKKKSIVLPISNHELKKEYNSGIDSTSLAQKYDVSVTTILNRLQDVNTKISTGYGSDKKVLILSDIELKEKYEKGILPDELAQICQCSNVTIYNRLKSIRCDIKSSGARFKGKERSFEFKKQISCTLRGISREEFIDFTHNQKYCFKFNEPCRERNRDKYGNKCFICGKTKEDNGNRRLSVHHVSRDKMDGCNGAKWNLIPLCTSCHSKAHHEPWVSRINYLLSL